MKTKQFDFFQTKGAATTMAAAIEEFKARNPKARRVSGSWLGAYPGDRNGRWVTIEMSYVEPAPYECSICHGDCSGECHAKTYTHFDY